MICIGAIEEMHVGRRATKWEVLLFPEVTGSRRNLSEE